jgi:hypothetical protein
MSLNELPKWRRAVGLLSLIGAALLTMLTVANFLSPIETPPPTVPLATAIPSQTPLTDSTAQPTTQANSRMPTAQPASLAQILATPVSSVPRDAAYDANARNRYDPFTYVPDRPRDRVEEYTVVSGDTVSGIAQRFGLREETKKQLSGQMTRASRGFCSPVWC